MPKVSKRVKCNSLSYFIVQSIFKCYLKSMTKNFEKRIFPIFIITITLLFLIFLIEIFIIYEGFNKFKIISTNLDVKEFNINNENIDINDKVTNNIIIEDKTVSETNKIEEIIIDFDNDEPVG